jgi:arylsulfatase A-like enzyme
MGSAGPLAGHKGQFTEGGIRVPFFLSWPGRLPAGQVHAHPVISLDILPTFCRAAGVPVPATNNVDGRDIVPELAGDRAPEPRILYWRQGQMLAAREGRFKLFKWPKPPEPVLYDLGASLAEDRNVANLHPEVYARLREEWANWSAELIEPATARFLAARGK